MRRTKTMSRPLHIPPTPAGSAPSVSDALSTKDSAPSTQHSSSPSGHWTLDTGYSSSDAHLAALGQLAAKVAHELNNPLDGIIRFISLAQRKLNAGSTDGVERYLSDAQFGLQRMADVLRELLEYGRSSGITTPHTDLAYLVEQAVLALEPLAQAHHATITFLPSNIPHRLLVPTPLYQVLCNLLKNSLDALADHPNPKVQITANLTPDRDLLLTVQDNGPGIPDDDLPHLFEPFFSRKSPHLPGSPGTGLGLTVCKEILDRLHGSLTPQNLPHAGCQFTITLPLPEVKQP